MPRVTMNLMGFLIVISLFEFINANENRTRCYGSYCFTILNEGIKHSSTSSCSPSYQNLEIYDDQMMDDVARFAKEIGAKCNYVELNLECQNATNCLWLESKKQAGFLKWKPNTTEFPITSRKIPAFKLEDQFEWTYVQMDVLFSTICMSDINALLTSDNSTDCTLKNFKTEVLTFVAVSVSFHLVALVTILALIASRKIQAPVSQGATSMEQDPEDEKKEISPRKSSYKRVNSENIYQALQLDDDGCHNYINVQRISTI